MDQKVAATFRAYVALNQHQKDELVRTMNEYINGTIEKKIALTHSAMRVDVGPVSSGGCPFCGK